MNKKVLKDWSRLRYNEIEEKIAQEIQKFLPEKVFDSHTHMYSLKLFNLAHIKEKASWFSRGPSDVTIGLWRTHMKKLLGKARVKGGLFTYVPFLKTIEDINKGNDFLLEQIKKNSDCYGLIVVSPDSKFSNIECYIKKPHVVGFKVYHVLSKERPTLNSSIAGFVPEFLWEIAHHYKLVILLHPVRFLKIADPVNYLFVKKMCKKYPGTRLILAHLGAGFNTYNSQSVFPLLKDIENIWLDISFICESSTIVSAIKNFGIKKIFWGSDYPLSQRRGRTFTVGDGFLSLDTENFKWDDFDNMCHPIIFGLESLRAVKQAAENLELSKSEIQDLFYNNVFNFLTRYVKQGIKSSDL